MWWRGFWSKGYKHGHPACALGVLAKIDLRTLVSAYFDWFSVVIPHYVDVSEIQSIDVFEHRVEFWVGESEHEEKTGCLVLLRCDRPADFINEGVTFSPQVFGQLSIQVLFKGKSAVPEVACP
jgi:hypothetical protein